MPNLTLTGEIQCGPASSFDSFPGGRYDVPVSFRESTKSVQAASGTLSQNLASPSVYQELDGVGAGNTVTQACFLYFKSDGEIVLRLTCNDGLGGTAVEVSPVSGLYVREFSTAKPLVLLEAQGTGRIEYFVAGVQ